MSKILIDNWTLQRAACDLTDSYNYIPKPIAKNAKIEHIKLIEAIILWDDIFFVNNIQASIWQNSLKKYGYGRFLKPYKLKQADIENFDLFGEDENRILEYVTDDNTVTDVVKKRAVAYSLFCNQQKITYMPCEERANYLKNHNPVQQYMNRDDVLNCLDNELKKFYDTVNEKFCTNKLNFSFPVLFDFVSANAKKENYIETALQIRNMPEVKAFREWMTDFEKLSRNGNSLMLEKMATYIEAIVKDITNVIPTTINGEVQFAITPSVSLPFKLGKSPKNMLHIDFIRTLANFGVTERK